MSREVKSWLYLLFLSAVWGASFILMKKAMYTADGDTIFSDTQVAALRMLFASVLLLPFALRGIRRIENPKEVAMLLIVGCCGNFFPAFLFTYAETGISSGYAGMLNSFTPIFALIIGFVVFRQRLTPIQLVGVFVGALGVVLLMFSGGDLSLEGGMMPVLAIVLATFCYAVSLNTIKHTLQKFKSFEITSLSFLFLLLPAGIIAFFSGSFEEMQTNAHAREGLTALLILSAVGTALAVVLFNKLVTISSVLFASSVTYLIPVFAVLIGLYYGETITWKQVASMGVVLAGVFVTNLASLQTRGQKK
jgi:drug/metabolite transporter (DMT)-like permease